MIKADYIYRGKEFKPKLQEKLKKLLELKEIKQQEYNKIVADGPFKKNMTVVDVYFEDKSQDDPKLNLEVTLREMDYQINKCKLLINECERSPRYKFILDFDEVYWLYN